MKAVEMNCFCKNKDNISHSLKMANEIVARNIDWKGNTLIIKSGNPKTGVTTITLEADFQVLENKLKECM